MPTETKKPLPDLWANQLRVVLAAIEDSAPLIKGCRPLYLAALQFCEAYEGNESFDETRLGEHYSRFASALLKAGRVDQPEVVNVPTRRNCRDYERQLDAQAKLEAAEEELRECAEEITRLRAQVEGAILF